MRKYDMAEDGDEKRLNVNMKDRKPGKNDWLYNFKG